MTKVKEELIKDIQTIAEDLQENHLLNIRDLMNTINENQLQYWIFSIFSRFK